MGFITSAVQVEWKHLMNVCKLNQLLWCETSGQVKGGTRRWWFHQLVAQFLQTRPPDHWHSQLALESTIPNIWLIIATLTLRHQVASASSWSDKNADKNSITKILFKFRVEFFGVFFSVFSVSMVLVHRKFKMPRRLESISVNKAKLPQTHNRQTGFSTLQIDLLCK